MFFFSILFVYSSCKRDEVKAGKDLTEPQVKSVNLSDNCSDVSATAGLTIGFTEPIDPASVSTNEDTVKCSGSLQISSDQFTSCVPLLSLVGADAQSRAFSVRASSRLEYTTQYQVRATREITDSSGNPLAATWMQATGFTTEAQPGTVIYWTKLGGGQEADQAKALLQDSAGDLLIAGRSKSDLSTANNGNWDFFLSKLNTTISTFIWHNSFGSTSLDYAEAAAIDGGDNIYLSGKTHGDFDGANLGGADIALFKVDNAGSLVWKQQFGSIGDDWAFDVLVSGNDLYLAGSTSGKLGSSQGGGKDLFLAKYDVNGTRQWIQQWGGKENEAAYSLALANGKLYVGGIQSPLDQELKGERKIILQAWSLEGSLQWSKELSSAGDDYLRAMKADSQGNLYLAGYSYGAWQGANQGDADGVLLKLDGDGNLLWASQLGSSAKDMGKTLVLDQNENPYLVGVTYGSLQCFSNQGAGDLFLASYSKDGALQWIRQTGSIGNDYPKAALLDNNNDLVIAGWSSGNLDSNLNQGADDIFLVKYNTTGTRQ